jgi:hypothetical protein
MDRSTVAKLTQQVERKFPEMRGVKPSVKRDRAGAASKDRYILTFKGNAQLPGGRTLKRIVRVVAEANGRIIRMSTSR